MPILKRVETAADLLARIEAEAFVECVPKKHRKKCGEYVLERLTDDGPVTHLRTGAARSLRAEALILAAAKWRGRAAA